MMTKHRRWKTGAVCLVAAAVVLSGCHSGKTVTAESQTESSAENNSEKNSENNGAGTSGNPTDAGAGKIDSFMIGETEVKLEDDDYYSDWSGDDVTYIKLADAAVSIEGNGAEADGNVVRITDGGTYVLSGSWSDGSVQVDAGDKGTVRLVLNGVEIHSEESAPIYVMKADKTVISLEDGTVNTLSDTEGLVYTDEEKEEPNATLFSKKDLTINGTGTLVVNAAFNHGINGKDNVILMSGNYQVTSARSAFKGKDLLAVLDGSYEITAGNDGMHSDGNLGIFGGTIEILESVEGLEGGTIQIADGDISIKSSDDGINASSDEEDVTPTLYISGGTVVVDAEGDGIDSNGNFYMTDGDVTVYGPVSNGDGALDYDGVFEMSGGQLAAFGMSGMAQGVSDGSTQNALMMTYPKEQAAGTEVVLKNGAGEELYRWSGAKAFNSLVIAVPELTTGESYVLETGESQLEFVLESAMIYLNENGVTEAASMRPMGGKGGMGGGPGGQRPDGSGDERPEGMPEGGKGRRPEGLPEGTP